MRVLIIDDDPTARVIVREALAGLPLDIAEAENAEQGHAIASALQPALVFLDIHMPEEEGLDLLPRLKAELAGTMVAIMTARPIDHGIDDLWLAQQLGADQVFTKPVPMDEVRRLAETALSRRL